MMKLSRILSIIAASTTALLTLPRAVAAPSGDWKIHPTFDANVVKVVDTPEKTYFQALAQNVTSSTQAKPMNSEYPFLFVYDKNADELISLSKRNMLTESIVSFISYNPEKEYLLAVYNNGNIDLLFDDDTRRNIPGMTSVNFSSGKGVNGATFDNENNRAWLATDFGYIVLDDKNAQIATSNVLNKKVYSVACIGGYVLMFDEDGAKTVPATEKFPTSSSFKTISGIAKPRHILPLGGSDFVWINADGQAYKARMTEGGSMAGNTLVSDSRFTSFSPTATGYILSARGVATFVDSDGSSQPIDLQTDDADALCGSWNGREFFFVKNRQGLYSKRLDNGSWTLTRDVMSPNAPGVFRTYSSMGYTPAHGVVVSDHGISRTLLCLTQRYPTHLSTYKNGMWERVAPVYHDAALSNVLTQPNGLAIDPDNPDYVYSGSYYTGLVRLNISDPSDIVRMTNEEDNVQGGTKHILLPSDPGYANIVTPGFDASGNLWAGYPNHHEKDQVGTLYVWPADKRKATLTSGNPADPNFGKDAWTTIEIDNWQNDFDMMVKPLTTSANNGIVVVASGHWGAEILIYDCNKTPSDLSDDKKVMMASPVDQDGNQVTINHIYTIYEDPQTGLVWILTDSGLFTFNPRQAFTSPNRVNRIKVARNDGTNLADYLLNGVTIYSMTNDSAGRKYFATAGGGIVVTSSDGREIISQFTTDNSYLPNNTVYEVCYNPAGNSVMVSTADGIAEYFPAGSSTGEDFDSVKIYPNPVRPDYYGWVTIEGLIDGAMVKIVDSAGNLVKELGFASGGSVQWDCSNINLKRVTSGVYFVMMSTSGEDSSQHKIGKILVVN